MVDHPKDEPTPLGMMHDADAPLVEEVLEDRRLEERQAEASFTPTQHEQIAALKAELSRLQASIKEIAAGSSQVAAGEMKEVVSRVERKLQENVFVAVAAAAFIGFIWGTTRR
ncbi:MAG: hypothetical protein JWM58_2292 [Rhizobium sp.]|nr:hypothetical protein [Rhizobium sp.]